VTTKGLPALVGSIS